MALKRGDGACARERLARAADHFPGAPPPVWHWAMALAAAELDDAAGARAAARTGVEAYPSHPVLQNNLAVLLSDLGRTEEAREILTRAAARGDELAIENLATLED